jgi:hypothetical protein
MSVIREAGGMVFYFPKRAGVLVFYHRYQGWPADLSFESFEH